MILGHSMGGILLQSELSLRLHPAEWHAMGILLQF